MDEWIRILRQVVAPVGGAYLVVVAMLLAYRRDRREGRTRADGMRRFAPVSGLGEWLALARYVLGMTAGGYVVFLLIVVTFYFVLGGEDRTFLLQAFREGSALAFLLVVPGFMLISWALGLTTGGPRRRRSFTGRPDRGDPPTERNGPA